MSKKANRKRKRRALKVKKYFRNIVDFFSSTKAIIKDISWPSKKETMLYSIAVLIISVIITAYLVSLDTIFNYLRMIVLFK